MPSLEMVAFAVGGTGTVLAGVLGILLWRTQRSLSKVSAQWLADYSELLTERGAAAALRITVARKDKKIHDLQKKLVALDPGAAFDDVFGVRGNDPDADQPETD